MTLEERLIQIRPSKRQLSHQAMEFYAFVHFTVNTFTDREWGAGKESPSIFNPKELDTDQWAQAIKSAGMTGLILTCKHHDGFCLWPSKYTEHTIAASPYKNGKGDIVAQAAASCKKYGLKFGVYLSPWDRNCPLYGQGKAYDDFFCNQLEELLTGYGDIFSVWFDGACGEGPNGKKQIYDFERYYKVIRQLQPNACISVCGPDVRWCGNEAGHCRPSEWSVVPLRTKDTEIIKEKSQKEDSSEFRQRKISAYDQDLGSRKLLENEPDLIWYPAEVNTSIRPGWFYHSYEDDKVRSLEELVNIYINSVGGNATFLLNIPPMPNGLFHKNDLERLQQLGDYLRKNLSTPFYSQTNPVPAFTAQSPCTNSTYIFSFDDKRTETIKYIVIMEDISQSQRIEEYTVEAKIKGNYECIYRGSVIGYKKIIRLDKPVKTDEIRLTINQCRSFPILSFFGLY